MGVEMLPAVLGAASLWMVRDATSSYTYALWMLGGCEFAAFCLWLLMPCARNLMKINIQKTKRNRKLKIINFEFLNYTLYDTLKKIFYVRDLINCIRNYHLKIALLKF
ncbi:hypothetical protein Avbf_10262 [Armadillidium vulgare]|nr:hypothetical protein Avbf_10262 [Armadillidium vulgare]